MAKIAVLGYGVVGSGTVEVFYKNKESLEKKAGTDLDIKYILDIRDFPDSPYAEKFTKSIDDILIADDKQALKAAILMALNDMEHEYETAYIKAALIRSHHLEPHISFSLFIRAICTFSGREYKYDPAQRVDTVIYHDEKEFMTSKSSKWQRGRRIVSYLTEVFRATQIQ